MSLPPYHWRHLKVMMDSLIETDYIFLLSGVLRYSSCLNTLLIKLESSSVQLQFENFQQIERTNSPNSHSTAQDCVRQHLVGVGMDGFEGSDMEMRLVKFLLLKAESLKIMSISIKEETRMHRSNIMEEINKYFKASIASEIVFS
ncbi:hypothetical protein F0562_008363 [Nyssa sinensis]|uniref:FBD domain-containing protein n=1 Tax=Nyssa sinensis TaxID=561372 RepID=A0A5J5A878_9ASTE|nr:hypothetical protein F0562_008363 [Nyssa sinensis]